MCYENASWRLFPVELLQCYPAQFMVRVSDVFTGFFLISWVSSGFPELHMAARGPFGLFWRHLHHSEAARHYREDLGFSGVSRALVVVSGAWNPFGPCLDSLSALLVLFGLS